MNKITIFLIVIILVAGAGLFIYKRDTAVDSEGSKSSQTTGVMVDSGQSVVIQGHQFPQDDLEIEVGTAVVWRNRDSFAGLPYDEHTVTSGDIDATGLSGVRGVVPNSGSGVSDGIFQSGLTQDEVFSYTFTEPGTYPFYIAEHPLVSGERSIIVKDRSDSIGGETIGMEAKSFSFSPNTLIANVGEVVGLNIAAIGQHTFTIDELDVNVQLPHGETTRVEFTPERAGTYEFYCSIAGHREAGQVGELLVE